jgi:hypothetical protein
MNSYALASASGLTFAFYFFLAISAAIAVMIYALLTTQSARRRALGLPTVRKIIAAPLALLVGLVVFSGIYLSSLAGFHTVTVGDGDIRMEYAVPHLSLAVRYDEIGDVIRQPAYRMQWRLSIYTLTGSKFESAPSSYRATKEAAEDIERRRKR